jgi:hypothetical protein
LSAALSVSFFTTGTITTCAAQTGQQQEEHHAMGISHPFYHSWWLRLEARAGAAGNNETWLL